MGKCDGVMSCLSLLALERLRTDLSRGCGRSASLQHQDPGRSAAQDGRVAPTWVAPLPTQPPLLLAIKIIYRTRRAASRVVSAPAKCFPVSHLPLVGVLKEGAEESCQTCQTTFQENRLQEQSPVWVLRSSPSTNHLLGTSLLLSQW